MNLNVLRVHLGVINFLSMNSSLMLKEISKGSGWSNLKIQHRIMP